MHIERHSIQEHEPGAGWGSVGWGEVSGEEPKKDNCIHLPGLTCF